MKSRAYQTTPTPVLDLLPSLLTTKTNRPLVAVGEAQKLSGNAYPNRYQLRADPVLKMLQEHMQVETTGSTPSSADWRNAKFVADAIGTCSPDAILVVEAWDQS